MNKTVKNEIIKFQTSKNNHMKTTLKNVAKNNMDYHILCGNYWKDMLIRIDKELSELEEK